MSKQIKLNDIAETMREVYAEHEKELNNCGIEPTPNHLLQIGESVNTLRTRRNQVFSRPYTANQNWVRKTFMDGFDTMDNVAFGKWMTMQPLKKSRVWCRGRTKECQILCFGNDCPLEQKPGLHFHAVAEY